MPGSGIRIVCYKILWMSATWELTVVVLEYNTPLESLIIQAVSITMCETCLQEVEGDK